MKRFLGIFFIQVICSLFLASNGINDSFAAGAPGMPGAPFVPGTYGMPKPQPEPNHQTIALQKALKKQGFNLRVDGIMGDPTRAAIKKFQKENGLRVTGNPDKATRAKLGLK